MSDYLDALQRSSELVERAIPQLLRDNTGGVAPTYNRVDTKDVDAELARTRSARDVLDATIDESIRNYQDSTAAEKAAISAKGQADADLVRANQEQSAETAAVFAKYGDIFGINASDIATVVHSLNEQKHLLHAEGTEIAGMQAVGPMDNVLEWWGNQIKLPSKVAEYNTRASVFNAMQETLDGYLKTANEAATYANKTRPAISAAQAKAAADAALAEAAKASAAADEKLTSNIINIQSKRFSADLAITEATEKSTKLEIEQRTNEFQAKIHAISFADNHANRLLNAAKLVETIAKNGDEMAQREQIGKILVQYDQFMGHPPGTTNYQVWRIQRAEDRDNVIAIGVGSMGATPVQAMINFYKARPGQLVSPETARFAKYIYDKAESWKVSANARPIPEKEKIDYVNKQVNEEIQQDIQRASTQGTPFYELSPARMVEAAQINPDSVLAKALAPLTEKKDVNIPTELVTSTIAKTFKNENDAAQAIADYYSRNIALRNSLMNTEAFRITLPTKYEVPTRIGMFTSKRLDLTKPADVMTYLLIQKRKETIGELQYYGNMGPP